MAEESLVGEADCRVSSVLGRNTRELGKHHLFDGSPETCWNSDQGTPQWVALRWKKPVTMTSIIVQFQGGFCGSHDTVVEVGDDESNTWEQKTPWHLEDVGTEQTLKLEAPSTVTRLRLHFPASTDLHGNILIWNESVTFNAGYCRWLAINLPVLENTIINPVPGIRDISMPLPYKGLPSGQALKDYIVGMV